MKLRRPPYSYRADPAVPRFADEHPVVIFDGQCVLCSRFMRFILRQDRRARFRFVVAQSPLGEALNRHYGLDPARRGTYLVLTAGMAYGKAAAFCTIMRTLGWPWRALAMLQWLPHTLTDWAYDKVRDNKYRLMGRTPACELSGNGLQGRLLDRPVDCGPEKPVS